MSPTDAVVLTVWVLSCWLSLADCRPQAQTERGAWQLTTDNWQQHQHLTSHLVTPRWTDMWRWVSQSYLMDTTCSWKLSVSPDQAGRCLLCSGGACCVFTTSYVTTDRPGITRPIWDHTHTALPPLSVLCVMVCILRWPPPIHHGQTNT